MANGSLRLARNRSGAPISLAVCAVLAVILVLLGRVQPTLFDRARAYASDRAAPALETMRLPLRAADAWIGNLADIFNVYRENMQLKEQNARLRQWQNAALALEQRLKRYRLLLNAVPDPELGNVTAHVIGRSNRPFLNTMILDAGRRQQVKPGEAVVDDRGMIGRIFLTGDHTSWVILLTDLNSRIPVSIEPGNVQAILAGDNSVAPLLEISGQGVHLRAGQQIVTSGDGALLPAGLSVGKVFWDGSDFRAGLYADSGHSDDVRVLDLKLPAEKLPSVSAGDLPVTAAGLAPLTPPPPKVTQPALQPSTAASPTDAAKLSAPARPTVAQQTPAAAAKPPAHQPPPAPDETPDDQ
ncbi:MAG TPA: rod shape-determining protein MreC [Rhizomicrobium sp.]|nr:rod shape-determining protein MreC [Rhizomicrobium sp.]